MTDIATRQPSRTLAIAIGLIVFGAAWCTGAVIAIREDALIGGVILGLLGYLCLAMGIGRARMALDASWYIRAGAEGLAFRTPAFGPSMLVGGYAIEDRVLSWSEVASCRPYPETGGPTENWLATTVERAVTAALHIEASENRVFFASTAPFLESQCQIADEVARSQSKATVEPEVRSHEMRRIAAVEEGP
jgi:hypothetical protein